MVSLFLSNEELGKKNDDHKPTAIPPIRAPQWNASARVLPRKLVFKRVAIALALGVFVFFFVKNIPTDYPIRDHRRPVYDTGGPGGRPRPGGLGIPKSMPQFRPNPKIPPLRPKIPDPAFGPRSAPDGGYDGPLTFPHLAVSLQAIYETRGTWDVNKNVLFAASSLQSAAALLPMACQMGSELRSYVHFALMGSSDMGIEELRAVNGIDDSCQIIFHDARLDHSSSSTQTRLETGASHALFHIHAYMHPQAMLVGASIAEEGYFLDAISKKARALGIPLLQLPEGSPKRLAWMTKLDSSSLASWNKISIDILIQAPPGASGNLIRLLKSLSAADFSGGPTPHLTIELPHVVDPPTAQFLESFQWPPAGAYNPTRVRQLTLRHRIPRSSLTEEESSIRFLESFWPSDPHYSHVLVLSPHVELSPKFYHYLKYSVLEYMNSAVAVIQEWDSRLLGISLDLPSTHLNASEPFTPPSRKVSQDAIKPPPAEADDPTPFLWQAPNSNAVLYTGLKWVELHDFVSRILALQHGTTQPPPFFPHKVVSKRYPSWLEHALELSRARGYWTLYPSSKTARNLAVAHHELYKAPEEYESEVDNKADGVGEAMLATGPLLESLPNNGNLLPFNEMPLLSWDGRVTEVGEMNEDAAEYTRAFRQAVGGCEKLDAVELAPGKSVKDLFCSRDD
ncbi:hypothetical protein B0T22DRAFT_459652 [Podospora appendiculata]|uniref:Glycosyltransferase 2 n=1 Tax=Podospora appendiculata TaxID=314037 RepID=A0AAE0X9J8_9PEZI|nr:hypothetical protein B0T22DRAFT_459652 [Podospora appendiculata]